MPSDQYTTQFIFYETDFTLQYMAFLDKYLDK